MRNTAGAKRVVVVGGACIHSTLDGEWCTKRPNADYINQLSHHFEKCTWLAVVDDAASYTGQVNSETVRIVPLRLGKACFLVNWWNTLRSIYDASYVILFPPATLPLLPVLPFIRLRASRLIVYLAGDYEMVLENSHGKWLGWSYLYRCGFEYPMRVADLVIARGKYLAQMARRLNPHVEETVPIGYVRPNRKIVWTSEPKATLTILYIGKMLWSKGLAELLRAFEIVCERLPTMQLELDLVGNGADQPGIETMARSLGVADRINFHGWVDDPGILDSLFARATLTVVPSSSHPEGVPRVIDEALCQGLPVIATRIGGIADEFDNDQVFLVAAGSVHDLAAAMEKLLTDTSTYHMFRAGAARRAAKWGSLTSAGHQHAHLLLADS